MNQNSKILIFGAGVIGSIYAMKFIEAGIPVDIFARGSRAEYLRTNGLQVQHKGKHKQLAVNVRTQLADSDVYDFIFVCVRYDQMQTALETLKMNQSPTIITMTNNSTRLSEWQKIIGQRLLPGFPAVGGQLKDGILHPVLPPSAFLKTMIGEIDGTMSLRLTQVTELYKQAKITYTIENDMEAYLITHSIMNIAMISVLHENGQVMAKKRVKSHATARKITQALKRYLGMLQAEKIAITPTMFTLFLKVPSIVIDGLFMILLRTKSVQEIMLSDYASGATNEIVELQRDFLLGNNK